MPVRGLQSLQKDLRDLGRNLERYPNEAARDGLAEVERSAKGRIMQNDAVASTALWRSFVQTETVVDVGVHRHRLANVAPHAKFVEFGTGDKFRPNPYTTPYRAPTMSPVLVREIKKWMVVKPSFTPYNDLNEAAIRVSLVISGNVEGKPSGTPAQPFFLPAWRFNRRNIRREIKNGAKKAVRRA